MMRMKPMARTKERPMRVLRPAMVVGVGGIGDGVGDW